MAEKLVNNKNAEKIISFLYTNQYFITKQFQENKPIYWYHALFSEFLLSRALHSFNKEDIFELKKNTALLLEEANLLEYAVTLFSEINEWNELSRLIIKHAGRIISQGRTKTLLEWLAVIPENIKRNNAWLLYWQGNVIFPFNPSTAIKYFEKSLERFKLVEDKTGMILSIISAINAIIFEREDNKQFDKWINVYDSIQKENSITLPQEIENELTTAFFFALVVKKPDHPDFEIWEKRAFNLFNNCTEINQKMLAGFPLILRFTMCGEDRNVEYSHSN